MRIKLVCLAIYALWSCVAVANSSSSNSTPFCQAQKALVQQYIVSKFIGNGPAKALGGVIAVYQQGQGYCVFTEGVSMPGGTNQFSADSIFELASITKIFTTANLGIKIVGDGFDANTAVSSSLPDGFELPKAVGQVSYQQLATFTGGFAFSDPPGFPATNPYTMSAFQAAVNNMTPGKSIFANGVPAIPTIDFYSNSSIGLLGQVLMHYDNPETDFSSLAAFETAFNQWLSGYFTGPLTMTSTNTTLCTGGSTDNALCVTGYFYNKTKQAYVAVKPFPFTPWAPAGALHSSPTDMLKLVVAMLCGYNPDANDCNELLANNSVNTLIQGILQAQQPQTYTPSSPNYTNIDVVSESGSVVPNEIQGFAWVVQSGRGVPTIIFKDGGHPGFSTWIGINPSAHYGIVILLNTGGVYPGHGGINLLNALPAN